MFRDSTASRTSSLECSKCHSASATPAGPPYLPYSGSYGSQLQELFGRSRIRPSASTSASRSASSALPSSSKSVL